MRPLRDHPAVRHPDLLVGLETADDAGVYRLPGGRGLVQSVDFFTPVVDEPFDWGRIAAANALSDLYAMGATPLTALQMLGWPRDRLPFDIAEEVIRGGAAVMGEAGCTIVGGHSVDSLEPTYGFAVTGLADPERMVTNAGARPGDQLILTKPLGTGIVSTAIKRGVCPPGLRDEAVAVMTTLNGRAARAMVQGGAHAATDVTGFGLLGHLRVMLLASGVSARLEAGTVPVLDGVRGLCEAGIYPGGSERNLAAARHHLDPGGVDETTVRVLADAQTSGGLLMAVPAERSRALAALGPVIGAVVAGEPGHIRLAL